MEKITYLVETLLNEQLGHYDILHDIALKDREYIVNMDVDSLWQTTEQKKQIAANLEQTRERILDLFKESGIALTDETRSGFHLGEGIRALKIPPAEKAQLNKCLQDIHRVKADVSFRTKENQQYLNDHLSVIQDIFNTVLPKADEGRYNMAGSVKQSRDGKHFIHAEV